MLRIEVNNAIAQISKGFSQLGKPQVALACMRAINRSLEIGRTITRNAVKQQYNIPVRYLNERVGKRNASTALLVGYITTSSSPVPMDAFAPKFEGSSFSVSISRKGIKRNKDFKRAKRSPRTGVSVEIIKGKRKTIPFAFLLRNGKARVFARGEYNSGAFIQRHKRVNHSGNDTPIRSLLSISVHRAVINDTVLSSITTPVQRYFEQRFTHELNRLLNDR